MVSKEFLTKLNTIINANGEYSAKEILYIGENLIRLYKTLMEILNVNENGNKDSNTTEKV